VLTGGRMTSFTTAGATGSIYLSVPTAAGVQTAQFMKDGLVSLTSMGNMQLMVQDAVGGTKAFLGLSPEPGTGAVVGFSNTYTSLYAETNAFVASNNFVSVSAAQSLYLSTAGNAAWLAVAGSSGGATGPTGSTGALSLTGAYVTLGAPTACSSGSGLQCTTGGGQVRVPNSALVLSSVKSVTCSATPTVLTVAELMTYSMLVISSDPSGGSPVTCAGFEFALPTPDATMVGTVITVVFDHYSAGTYPSSPTSSVTSSDYISVKYKPDNAGSTYITLRVAARSAVSLIVYASKWSGATQYTYAVVGAMPQSLTLAPWTYY